MLLFILMLRRMPPRHAFSCMLLLYLDASTCCDDMPSPFFISLLHLDALPLPPRRHAFRFILLLCLDAPPLPPQHPPRHYAHYAVAPSC